MAGKVITRLELQDGNYNSGLAKAGRSLKQFQQQNLTLDGAMQSSMKSLLKLGAQYVSFGAAVAGSMKLVKDAFMASEQNVDEWGRTVEAAGSLYEGFLTSLNTGDISGFLSRIDQITNAAYEAYNALDTLNTQKTIQSPQLSAKQAEISRLRAILQSGKYIAPADSRTPSMKTGEKLSDEQLKSVSKQLESALAEVAAITKSQVQSATDAIDKLYNEQAEVLRISKKKFLDATSSWEKFRDALDKGAKYEAEELQKRNIRAKANSGISITAQEAEILNRKNPYQDWSWVKVFKDDGEKFKRIVEEIQKRDAASSQLYNQYGQAYRRINRVENKPTSTGISDQQKAEELIANAQREYQQSIQKANMELQSGVSSEADVKKATLSAQERLWEAYGKAYSTYADPKYKEAQDEAAQKIVELGGTVKSAIDAEKEAERAARQLERANEKLAEARTELANAQASGNLKDIYAAQKKVTTSEEEVKRLTSPATTTGNGNVVANTENLQAQIAHLKEQLTTQQIGSADFNQTQTNLADANALQNIINKQMGLGIAVDPSVTQRLFDQILNGENIPDDTWQSMVDTINARLKELDLDPLQLNFQNGNLEQVNKQAETAYKNFSKAANAISSVGGALQSIEDPAAKVAGIVAEAIANIAASFAASLKGTFTPWDWIAAATAGTAVMVSTIASIKSATAGAYAEGGFITGGAGVGDSVPILANQGEYVMNQNELGAVAGMVESAVNNNETYGGQPYVSGEQIFLGLNNYGRRTGKGELTFSHR